MKKVILYIIFFISLVLLGSSVYAEEVEFSISRTETRTLMFTDYEGISCSTSGLHYLQYNQVNEYKGEVSYAGNDFPDDSNYTESLTCSYTDIISQSGVTSGTLTYTFTFNAVARSRATFILIKNKLSSYNLFGYYGDTDTRFIDDIGTIVSFGPNNDKPKEGNSYFSYDCPVDSNSNCTITIKDNFPESATDGKTANYILKYIDKTGWQAVAEIDVVGYPSQYIIANYGGIGTCNFDSSWTNSGTYSKQHKLVVGDSVTLPTCNNSNTTNPLLKFEGWIDVSQHETLGVDAQRNNLCVDYVNVTPGSSIVMSDNLTTFLGCYTTAEGLILELNGGEFRLGSNATVLNGKAYVKTSSSYSLPDVTKIPEMYDVFGDATFVGWQDEGGNILPPGTSVSPDGQTYFAKFSNSSVSQENTFSRVIYIDEPESIVGRYGTTMKTCTSADPLYVETVISGNECMLYGNLLTDDEYINVFVTYEDGTSEVYKVRVEEYEGQVGGSDGSVDLDGNADFGVSAAEGNEITYDGVTTCDKYIVYAPGITVRGIAYHNSNRLGVTEYRAESTCDSTNVHLALCMDPGRGGPNASRYTYYLDESFDPTNDFGRLIRHIVKQMVEKGVDKNDTSAANTHIISAANIALRVVQYYSLDELASDASPRYAYHVAAYKALGDSLKSKCGSNLEICSATDINAALDAWSWSAGFEDVRATVVDFLASYETLDEEEDVSEIEGEAQVTSMIPNGDNADIYIEGTIKFENAAQMNNYTMTADCPGFTCELTWNQKYTHSNEWKYRMVWHVTAGNAQLISTLKAGEKPAVVLTDNATGATNKVANVFVLKPEASNLQRMVIFNTEAVKIRVEVPTNVCSLYRAEFAQSENHPSIPAIIRPSSDTFNATLFKEFGCCSYIPDSSETHKTYCSQYCYTSNFSLYCDPNSTGNNDGTMVDTYSLKEGYVGGVSDGNKLFTCVVDVTNNTQTGIVNTNKKVDFAGNKYLVHKNKYCAVSCREEWDVSLPSFDSFIEDNSVIAGMYFVMDKYIFMGTKRQCYTTYIDYAAYVAEQQALADDIMRDHGIHSEYTKVYSNMKSNLSTETVSYNTYYYNSSENYKCHDVDGDGEGSKSADGCAEYETYTVSCNCRTSADGSRSCSTCTRRRCVRAKPCRHTCHVWHSESHSCTLYTVGNTSSQFRYYDQQNISHDGNGDQRVTSVDAGSFNAYTSNNLGDSSSNIDDVGSTLKSHYEVGSRPAASDHYAYDNNGVCCGAETYKCGGVVANHDYIIDKATYYSYNFSVSGNVKDMIENKANTVKSKTQTLENNAKYMSYCQNYYLTNDTSDPAYSYNKSATEGSDNYSGVTGGRLFQNSTILTSTAGGYKVQTKFEPKASYKYEEIYFMNELAKDANSNVIQVYTEKNNEAGVPDGGCVEIDRKDQAGKKLKLCRSGKEIYAYNPTQYSPWTNEVQGKSYSGSGDTTLAAAKDSFHIPVCKTLSSTSYEYNASSNYCETTNSPIYKIHYLTKSLANSSYFRNKGQWYIDSVTDAKAHGDNKTVAVSNNSSSMSVLTTNIYGAKYNTFPVALDTPRNIYQYTYAFKDIGMFPDGTPGRIMGDGIRSMVVDNTRNCFYEVIEELCTCCGDPILFYSYETSRIDETNSYLDNNGHPFDPSRTDYDSKNSILNILNSSVSLYDPSGGDGNIAGNWSSTDKFVYEGNVYTTNKGAELYEAIMEKGELVYDTTNNNPEYSYTINPSLMSTIRTYNGSHRYGYSRSTVRIVGNKICFNSSGSCSDSDENSGYFHFASKFLEESFMVDAITPEYRSHVNTSKTGSSSSCQVSDASNVHQGSYSNCRWIDYVENVGGKNIKLALK